MAFQGPYLWQLPNASLCPCPIVLHYRIAEAMLKGFRSGSRRGPGCPRTRMVTSILKWAGMDYNALKAEVLARHHQKHSSAILWMQSTKACTSLGFLRLTTKHTCSSQVNLSKGQQVCENMVNGKVLCFLLSIVKTSPICI